MTAKNPLGYAVMVANPTQFIVVAANAETGKVQFCIFLNNCDVVKASCSISFACHPYFINGVPYYDGALGDTVPIEKAFSLGCDKVVLIFIKPRNFRRTPDQDRKLAARIRKKYPLGAAQLEQRAEKYNAGVDLAKRYEEQGKLLIVAPDDTFGMDTLTRSQEAMKRFYKNGVQDGEKIAAFWIETFL